MLIAVDTRFFSLVNVSKERGLRGEGIGAKTGSRAWLGGGGIARSDEVAWFERRRAEIQVEVEIR